MGGARQTRAIVADQDADGVVVAALDDDVRDGLGDRVALGHGAQVPLALGADHVEQVGFLKRAAGAQDRAGDLLHVHREGAGQAARRGGRGGEADRQFLADGLFHLGGKLGEDGAVELVLGGVGGAAAEEVVREFAQELAPLLAGRLSGQIDEVLEAGCGHWRRSSMSIS